MAIPPANSLSLDRDDQGRLIGARRVDPRGIVMELSIERRIEREKAVASATIKSHNELLGRITSEISVKDEFISLEFEDGQGSALWWRMEFSEYDRTHLARVQLAASGLGESVGVYSPLLRRGTLQLAPDYWLSDEQARILEEFRPVFEALLEQFQRGLEPYRELIERTMAESRWGLLGHVACRAFATMVGTAIGAVIGGPPGAVAGAGIGSVASDLCP